MNCLSEGRLQAYLDEEVGLEEAKQMKMHLSTCSKCQERYEEMLLTHRFTVNHLNSYSKAFEGDILNSATPSFRGPVHLETYKGVNGKMKKYQKILATVAVVGLVVVGVSAEPVRAAVSDAVSIFRADKIETVDVSLGSLQALEEGLRGKEGSIHVENLADIEQSGGESSQVTLEEAKGMVSFKLDFPEGIKDKKPVALTATGAEQVDFTLKIDAVNELMRTLGATSFFEEALDGKTFTVSVPASLQAEYSVEGSDRTVYYSQTKMPEIIAPKEADTKKLIDAVASLGVLPTEIQSKIKTLSDVENTLYIPNVDGKVQTKTLGGNLVYYYFETFDGGNYGTATWLEDGVLKTLSGNLDERELEHIMTGQ